MKKITLTKVIHIIPVIISVIALCIAITKPTKVVTTNANEKVVVEEEPKESAVQKNCRHNWSTVTEDKNNHSIVLSCDKCGLIEVINTLKYGEY
ncbi:hypothetical protein [Thomasclavelia cocleata]|jgi:hypothetical protein|uniref:hypothetical protein n=1 Tax=Thomasclavelia cocleata TaxID=69824 RepID=UPI00256EBD7B|nr:hypothetical protein [Thomasclavelia cocleata]